MAHAFAMGVQVHDALGPGLRKLALSYFALSAVGSMLVSTPPVAAASPAQVRPLSRFFHAYSGCLISS
jgi:hypothetical protein